MKFRLPLSFLFAVAATSAGSELCAVTTSTAAAYYTDPLISSQWQWDTSKNGIDIAAAWALGYTGSGVVIGIIDTWVEPDHEDLNVSPYNTADDWTTANLSDGLSYDFVGDESLTTSDDEDDDDGDTQIYTGESHGTFVAGMAAATGGNGTGLVGAAPGATIAGLHVGSDADSISITYATYAAWWGSGVSTSGTYTGEAEIQIKNCSFGSYFLQAATSNAAFLSAIETTSKNNVIYVFSAGNNRTSSSAPGNTAWSSYGNSTSVINVAATNTSGTYATFSNYGSNVFISAPGQAVVSTDRTGSYGYNSGSSTVSSDDDDDSSSSSTTTSTDVSDSNYATSSGTSFSAPIVSGVIALGKEACPVMDVRWAKWALAYSSGHGDSPNIDYVYNDDAGTYVQKSTSTTGEWGQNAGGYWFNNNYGFGIIDPEGFLSTVINMAYTTVETSYTANGSYLTKTTSKESYGTTRSATYAVLTDTTTNGESTSLLGQSVETVSVTITLSADALSVIDLNTLSITITDSNGYSSVLVESSSMEDSVYASTYSESSDSWSYTFLTNAFWGTTYTDGDWTVELSYSGVSSVLDTTGYITVDSVEYTMGEMVFESSNLAVASGDTVNAHALVLDSGKFTVNGSFFVEDAVYVNAGTFTISSSGEVGAYSSADLNKGAIFVQNGGTSIVYGNATFSRGLYLYGGNFTLSNSIITTGSSTYVYGGSFLVYGTSGVGTLMTVDGGTLTLKTGTASSGTTSFSSPVVVNSGTFAMETKTTLNSTLTLTGGEATLATGTTIRGAVSVGATATSTDDEDSGGTLTIASDAKVTVSNINFAGTGVGVFNTNSTVTGNVTVSGNAAVGMLAGTTLNGALTVTGGETVWAGTLTADGGIAVSDGTLAASGTTTLYTPTLTLTGGTFAPGKTTIADYYASSKDESDVVTVTIGSGANLYFSATSKTDYDLLTIASGVDSLVFDTEDGTTTITYDFGNAIPFSADIIFVEDSLGTTISLENSSKLSDITVSLSSSAPTILEVSDDGTTITESDLEFSVTSTVSTTEDENENVTAATVTYSITTEQELANHTLRYSYQTDLQIAVQEALLRNETKAADFIEALDELELVSDVLAAYDALGTPINVIAIEELHDKQANAITSAISRRSRELRSGFIHSDMWSNPLFGKAGFSYSARPSLVAATTGFVPYITAEDDFPLMVWINGGFSFSEADDDVAASLSTSKTRMFNVEMGVDYSINEAIAVGIFAGYTTGRTKFDDSSSRTEIQSRNLGVYATGSLSDKIGTFYYTGLAAIGFEEYDFHRSLTLGDVHASADANPDGWQGIGFIEAGYEWSMEKLSMGPALSLRYVSNHINSYTESSSAEWMRLHVDSASYDSLQTSLGWRIAYRADFELMSLMPELRASWNHEFLGIDKDFDASLTLSGAQSYTNSIAETGDDYATLGIGLTMMLGEVSTLSFDYDVQLFRDNTDPTHTINAIFRTRF